MSIIPETVKKLELGKFGNSINIINIALSLANLLHTIDDILQESFQVLFELFQWKIYELSIHENKSLTFKKFW